MVFDWKNTIRIAFLGSALAGLAIAAPMLQVLQPAPPLVTVNLGSNGTGSIDIKNAGDGTLNATASSSATWLTATIGAAHACSDGSGTNCLPVQLSYQTAALAKGTYVGVVTVNDPNAIDAPQAIVVSVEVGSGVPDTIDLSVPAGGQVTTTFATAGQVTLTTATPGATPTWLTTAQNGGSPFSPTIPYLVTVNAGSLAAGDYSGTIAIAGSNNAAENKTVTVKLHVKAAAVPGPVLSVGGAINNANFAPGESLAQGGIIAVFGTNLTSTPAAASSLPLGTTLGGVQLFYNDQPVPLYYVSANQINFQLPFNAAIGAGRLRISSNGANGNTISITVAKAVPRILQYTTQNGPYGIITNADNTLVAPAALGGVPAKVGSTVVIYALGFGPTTPPVDSGAASPTSPLATVTDHPQVCFSPPTPFNPSGICVTPSFAGLAPGFVGLYQINAAIPANAPTGDFVPVQILTDDGATNTVQISVQ